MRFHRTNVVICEVVTVSNRKWTPIICAYLLPSTLEHLLVLEEALTRFWDHSPIVVGDLSANIGQYQNLYIHQVAELLMEFGIMDLLLHFRQRCWCQHMKTWYWVRQGRVIW